MRAHKCALGGNEEAKAYNKLPWYKKRIHISTRSPQAHIFYRTDTAIILAKKKHYFSRYYYIVHPFSIFRMCWETLMAIVFSMYLFVIPVSIGYIHSDHKKSERNNVIGDIHRILDLVCLIDVVLTFLTGYIIHQKKQVVLEPRAIAMHYLFGYFFIDVLSSLPVAQLGRVLGTGRAANLWKVVDLLPLLKICRIHTLIAYIRRGCELYNLGQMMVDWIIYLLLSTFTFHWCGCFQYIIPIYIDSNVLLSNTSWIVHRNIGNYTVFWKYLECLFKASTLLFCVSNDLYHAKTMEDKVIEIIVGFIGYLVAGLALVFFLQMTLNLSSSEIKYHSIMNQLSQFMRHKQLPLPMQKRLKDYYEYKFRGTYFRENTIIPTISEKLRNDISRYECFKLMRSVSILKDLPSDVSTKVALACKQDLFLPNDIIFKSGMTSDCMYFIDCGTVAVFTPTGKEVCHLQDGAYFGEMGLISKDQKRFANVVALETTVVYKLERKHFNMYIKEKGDFFKKIQTVAERRRENTMVMEEIHRKHILERTMKKMDDMS